MPTMNNRGRLFWGSAWRLEPRRGTWAPSSGRLPSFRKEAPRKIPMHPLQPLPWGLRNGYAPGWHRSFP